VDVASDVTINGNLTVTSGDFRVSSGGIFTLTVTGNASFQGGLLDVSGNIGVVDVAGNVTFSGTSVSSTTPTIRCGGNWSSDANFVPNGGAVVFDKIGSQAILAVAGALPNVTVQAGSITSAASLHSLALTVSGSLSVTPGTLDVDGAVTVAPAAT